jgi:hypothetical protein
MIDGVTFMLIGAVIITPLFNYLLNSRCTHIKTPCCEIDRELQNKKSNIVEPKL